jgi:hypothetical protein
MTRRVPRKLILAASALLALTATAYADWQDQVTPRDIERLAHLNDARDDALARPTSAAARAIIVPSRKSFAPPRMRCPNRRWLAIGAAARSSWVA